MERFKIYNRRYLGSKYKLLEFIEKIVEENTENSKLFLDLFAGTGVVADYFNKKYDVVLNDLLKCNYFSYECFFSNLEYDEKKLIEIMKKYNKKIVEDNNYYSENFKDTYLSEKNLKKVGFIRDDIDDLFEKKEINKREKAILITSLIYAVDRIANTVGHYDAYRKNGDLEKELILKFPQIENENNKNNKIFCMDANELVKKFSADIVYIDPPYNSRQYSDAYHFLENIATNEKPDVFGVARKMDRTHIKSKYCLSSAKKTLEELIEEISAKYILFSYNNTQQKANSRSNARINDNEILEILKSKGEVTVFEKDFSPFTVGKTNIKNHTERVFFCRVRKAEKNKKNSKENIINNTTEENTVAEENQLFILENIKKKMVQSPLNYTGGKFRLLKQIFEKIPENIDVFYDIFCGGFNVGANFNAKKIIGIDKNKELIKLLKFLKKQNYEKLEKEIEGKIEYYNLSNSFKNGYEYYGCNSYDGLGKYNKEKFLRLREDYNNQKKEILFLLLIFYSFNNQIRFNKKNEFNLPVGKRDFNSNLRKKLKNFIFNLQLTETEFQNMDFRDINLEKIDSKNTFFYLDPPYLLGQASYNENNLWTENDEKDLLKFLEKCNEKGIKFALSNVIEHKGNENRILKDWCLKNKFCINYLDFNYYNSNYQIKKKNTITREVLITNFNR